MTENQENNSKMLLRSSLFLAILFAIIYCSVNSSIKTAKADSSYEQQISHDIHEISITLREIEKRIK